VNILNKKLRAAENEWSSSLGGGQGLITPHLKNSLLRMLHREGFCEHGNEPSGIS